MNRVIQDIHFEPEGNSNSVIRCIDKAISDGAKSLLIMSCDNDFLPGLLDHYLKTVAVPVFGGIFPKIVYQKETHDHGFLIISLNVTASITVLKENCADDNAIASSNYADCDENSNLFIFADAYMKNIDQLLYELYETLKPQTSAIGSGCGASTYKQKPCLFCNDGLLENALIVASVQAPIDVSSAHGWDIMTGPYLVTSCEGNIIYTLNHSPALQVYKDAIRNHTGKDINVHGFHDMARTHPLGLDQLDSEILVREPVSINKEALVCVGCVPENSSVYILKGENKQIIHAAGQAAFDLNSRLNGHKSNATFFLFNGISRALYLGDESNHEISLVQNILPESAEIITAFSIGEISLNRSSTMRFHNKSVVIGSVI